MFKDLDAILHSQLRLAIISILMGVEEAEFTALKEMTNASAGNLSLQLEKLKERNYISVKKSIRNKYPVTKCRITKKGAAAFEAYAASLKEYLEVKNSKHIVQFKLISTSREKAAAEKSVKKNK